MSWPVSGGLGPVPSMLAWILGVALLAALAPAVLQARPATAVLGDSGQLDTEPLSSVWLDDRGAASIDEVVQGGTRFSPARPGAVHALGPGKALWMRLRLVRQAQAQQDWLVSFPNPELDYVTVWQQAADGRWHGPTGRVSVAVDSWPEPGRYPCFRLNRSARANATARRSANRPLEP